MINAANKTISAIANEFDHIKNIEHKVKIIQIQRHTTEGLQNQR